MSDIEQGGAKDALPLLAFTLERLYRYYGADGDLQLAEYEKLGRIRGAIEAAVEQALGKAEGFALDLQRYRDADSVRILQHAKAILTDVGRVEVVSLPAGPAGAPPPPRTAPLAAPSTPTGAK